jgi:hypothetical protein
MRKKIVAAVLIVVGLFFGTCSEAWADTGWGATTSEWLTSLGYDGKVWIKPCQNFTSGGKTVHVIYAKARHIIPGYSSSGWQEVFDKGPSHCSQITKTWQFWDSLDPFAPKTKFEKSHSTAPKGVW